MGYPLAAPHVRWLRPDRFRQGGTGGDLQRDLRHFRRRAQNAAL